MPSIAVTRPYEVIYILDPDLGEEQVGTITARYRGVIENNGGEVQKIDVWERRKLAYEVKGRNEGIYVVMQFTGVPSVEAELRRIFQISEDQLRFMIVKPEEATPDALPVSAPAAPAPVQAAAPAPAQSEPVSAPAPAPVVQETDAAPTQEAASAPPAAPDPTEGEPAPAQSEPAAA